MAIVNQTVHRVFELEGAAKEMKSNHMDLIEIIHLEGTITHLDFNRMRRWTLTVWRPEIQHLCLAVIEPFSRYVQSFTFAGKIIIIIAPMPGLAYGTREFAHVANVFKGITTLAMLTDLAGPGMKLMGHI